MQVEPASTPVLYTCSLERYIDSVRRIRLLSAEEEREITVRWWRDGDVEAARSLVLSHLPLVISVARGFLNYGLPYADLVQEGNVGLMKAVKHFDPNRGIRFAGYAVHWIRAEIHEYIMRNWRLVKAATTKQTRRLFFRLRSAKLRPEWLTNQATDALCHEFDVAPIVLRRMEAHLYGADVTLPSDDDYDDAYLASLPHVLDPSHEPCGILEEQQWSECRLALLYETVASLDDRCRKIIERRWLNENQWTLSSLGDQFGITTERVRQLEAKALRQLAIRMRWRLLEQSRRSEAMPAFLM